MKYRTLGKSGYSVSEIGFGAWAIGGSWGPQEDKDSLQALHEAIDRGVTFIDTAAGYGNGRSEKLIAQVLRDRKEEITVATKTPLKFPGSWPPTPYDKWEDRYGEAYLRENVEERLRNLQVERLDLLQLHTWTRAWNRNPQPFEVLRKLQSEGKIARIGVSTPEHDQNAVIDLMRNGWVDTVQVIYNIFEQEPAAELLPVAKEHNVGIIVRVAMEEGALTGKFSVNSSFPKDDFRRNYFAGDRLKRVVKRVDRIKEKVDTSDCSLAELALCFALEHPAVSTVIAGMRNPRQVQMNVPVSDLPPLPHDLKMKLRQHAWLKQFWHSY
ncbi:MAG TPA: aldo/keto reductase [Oceanipulchritudo sp.]|nr:aldo/keto reductase [Oceanipulchritudo sp.]